MIKSLFLAADPEITRPVIATVLKFFSAALHKIFVPPPTSATQRALRGGGGAAQSEKEKRDLTQEGLEQKSGDCWGQEQMGDDGRETLSATGVWTVPRRDC